MVVDGDGEGLLGVLLAYAGQVKLALDLGGLGNAAARLVLLDLGGEFLVQDLFAERDAVVADENTRPLDQLLNFGVGLAAETAQGDACLLYTSRCV